jgi:hypothetical protein
MPLDVSGALDNPGPVGTGGKIGGVEVAVGSGADVAVLVGAAVLVAVATALEVAPISWTLST